MTTRVISSISHISYKKIYNWYQIHDILYNIYMIFDKEYKISDSLIDILINYLCFINS